jgi:hypothetical protein
MKKYLNYFILATIITTIFTFSGFAPVASAITTVTTTPMTISQLVELLITIGVIAPDKAVAARAAVTGIPQTPIIPVVAQVISTSTSYVQVLTPNGGESWDIDLDLPYSITWGSTGLTQAYVALVSSVAKTPICNLSQLPVISKNGTNTFKTLLRTAKCYNLTTGTSTPVKDGTYKVRVYFTGTNKVTIQDESNATFKITPKLIPSVTVTYPNGTEQLVRNREYTVKYTLKNVDSNDELIYYYLLDSSGNNVLNGHKAVNTTRSFDLDLPSSLSAGAYKLKVKTTVNSDNVDIEDTSNNFFWVSSSL